MHRDLILVEADLVQLLEFRNVRGDRRQVVLVQPGFQCDGFEFGPLRLSSSLLLSSLELSDTKVYDPQIRALLGTASLSAVHLSRHKWPRFKVRLFSRSLLPVRKE